MRIKLFILTSLVVTCVSPVNVFADNNEKTLDDSIINNIISLFKYEKNEKSNSKKVRMIEEEVSLTLTDKKRNEVIEYSVFANNKWSSYVKEGTKISPNAQGIKVRLSNNKDDREVIYRVKTSDGEYSAWVTENVIAGELKSNKVIREVEIKVIDSTTKEYQKASRPKIAIDMGHNIPVNAGATGIVQEDVVIKEVGEKVIEQLKEKGFDVVDVLPETATTVKDSLEQRVYKSKINESDIFVSIHFNASVHHNAKGTEVFYALEDGSKELSQNIVDNIAVLGFHNRGIKDGETGEKPLYVLTKTDIPAVLVECAFITSMEDMDKYDANLMATSIANGIIKYINEMK